MIDCIIFSKNRAMQLHLLLDSIYQNNPDFFNSIYILYHATGSRYMAAYDQLFHEFRDKNIWGIHQKDFAADVLFLLYMIPEKRYMSFLVDDNIMFRECSLKSEEITKSIKEHNIKYFSLRLGLNTKYEGVNTNQLGCTPKNYEVIEDYSNPIIKWDAGPLPSHTSFGYPFSVDGHIMQVEHVEKILGDYEFDTPNALEGRYIKNIENEIMGCCLESCIVNTPLNLVGSSQNWIGKNYSISLEELNNKYLKGIRPDIESMDFSNIIGCHQELELEFK